MSTKCKLEWRCTQCRPGKSTKRNKKEDEDDDRLVYISAEEEVIDRPPRMSLEEKIDTLMMENRRTNKLVEEFMDIISELRNQMKEKEQELRDNVREFEQHYRNNYIELHNVGKMEGEESKDLEEVIMRVGREVGVVIEREEIEAIHRIPTRNKNKHEPIIVHLSSRRKRNELLQAKKNKRITQDKIIRNGKTDLIYINESLTKYHKELLYKAKGKAAEKGYKFTWTKEGKIYMRMNETSTVKRIRNEGDLEKL